MIKIYKCKDITELISLKQEQKISFKQQVAIDFHLLFCPYCRAFKRNCEEMHGLMQQFKDKEEK